MPQLFIYGNKMAEMKSQSYRFMDTSYRYSGRRLNKGKPYGLQQIENTSA
ncbi:hypothetical protein JCM11672_20390 [Alkaliphilus crotonatoxidans]